MTVGVLRIQGDVSEHVRMLEEAVRNRGLDMDVRTVKTASDVGRADALVMPGGESTTISKLMVKTGVDAAIKEHAKNGRPLMATCAGLILVAMHGDEQVERTETRLLGLVDVTVSRNAFGRQRESFEQELNIPAIGNVPFHGVFIRAPGITRVGGGVNVLARYGGFIVAVESGNILALAFHPELTGDARLHEYFLRKLV